MHFSPVVVVLLPPGVIDPAPRLHLGFGGYFTYFQTEPGVFQGLKGHLKGAFSHTEVLNGSKKLDPLSRNNMNIIL